MEPTPSILALPQLRSADADRAVQPGALLRLDPLTVLRAIAMAAAPPARRWRDALPTVGELTRSLGPGSERMLLNTPNLPTDGGDRLLRLWLRALGTAEATSMLCQDRLKLDPERGWLLGLLVDTPDWLACLTGRDEAVLAHRAWSWLRERSPMAELADQLEESTGGDGLQCWPGDDLFEGDRARRRIPDLIQAATYLVELAGFHHPDRPAEQREVLLRGADLPQRNLADTIGRRVIEALEDVGLADWIDGPNVAPTPSPERPPIDLPGAVHSALVTHQDEPHLHMMQMFCKVATGSLGFDRAWAGTWVPDRELVVITASHLHARSEADPVQMRLSLADHRSLSLARETGQPKMLRASPEGWLDPRQDGVGMLPQLASTQVLAQVILRRFQNPLVLLADHGLSCHPVDAPEGMVAFRALGEVAAQVVQNRNLAAHYRRARKMATVDALTRLANRWVGIHNMGQEVVRSRRTGAPLSVLLLDLDDFKQLNDAHGHLVGDEALRVTADVLRDSLRRSDTCCRFGGEEFLVVMPNTTAEDAAVMATRLFTAIEARGQAVKLPLTVSIGMASLTSEDDTPEDVLARADRALYASKSRGRNRFAADVGMDL